MTPPLFKKFDRVKFYERIKNLPKNIPGMELERFCEEIVVYILLNYEGFEKVVPGPKFVGTTFDYFGIKDGKPYIIEFKGSQHNANYPNTKQNKRMKMVVDAVPGLNPALLQVRLKSFEYRIFYDKEKILKINKEYTIEPIVDWINENIKG